LPFPIAERLLALPGIDKKVAAKRVKKASKKLATNEVSTKEKLLKGKFKK